MFVAYIACAKSLVQLLHLRCVQLVTPTHMGLRRVCNVHKPRYVFKSAVSKAPFDLHV
jgi:hypothetical protein